VLKFSCCEKTNFLYNNTKTRVETTQFFVLWKIFSTKFAVMQHKNFNTNIFKHTSDFEHGSFKCVAETRNFELLCKKIPQSSTFISNNYKFANFFQKIRNFGLFNKFWSIVECPNHQIYLSPNDTFKILEKIFFLSE
jgi:hypothetical protein